MPAIDSSRRKDGFERVQRPSEGYVAKDPSPSRIKYRLERIWLTPLYRRLIQVGVPVIIVGGVLFNHFSDPVVQEKLSQSVTNTHAMIENRPEFAVNLMEISNVSPTVAKQVREAVPISFPISSLKLDLATLKERIEAVDAVKSADIFLRDGVLDVQLVERVPSLIWRGSEHLELLDANGVRAGVAVNRKDYQNLPLIVGNGAQSYAAEALEILAVSKPIANRIRGLRRVGERRWDVILDRKQIIQLPTDDPTHALQRVIALHLARDVLGRDITVVDMRDGRRPVLRLSQVAVDELNRLRAIADGENKT